MNSLKAEMFSIAALLIAPTHIVKQLFVFLNINPIIVYLIK